MSKTFEEIKNTDDLNALTPLEYCIWFTSVGSAKQFSIEAAAELARLRQQVQAAEALFQACSNLCLDDMNKLEPEIKAMAAALRGEAEAE